MKSYAPLPKEKQERKRKIKEIATDVFSSEYNNNQKITYAVSDAALIALFGMNWQIEGGKDE